MWAPGVKGSGLRLGVWFCRAGTASANYPAHYSKHKDKA